MGQKKLRPCRCDRRGNGAHRLPLLSNVKAAPIYIRRARSWQDARPAPDIDPGDASISPAGCPPRRALAHPTPLPRQWPPSRRSCRGGLGRIPDGRPSVNAHESVLISVQVVSSREVTSWMRRSIRPTRARRPFDASVDHTEARNDILGCFGQSDRSALRQSGGSRQRPWTSLAIRPIRTSGLDFDALLPLRRHLAQAPRHGAQRGDRHGSDSPAGVRSDPNDDPDRRIL